MTDPSPWWRDAVVNQLYIRSFTDADGNGIGDIDGMRSRLPYLRDLGVDAVWVNPWFVSPMVDGGYDVADYRDIDPLFGDLADAEAFLDEAHALGIRVLLDIVPNDTSDRHPWFQAALAAGPPGGGRGPARGASRGPDVESAPGTPSAAGTDAGYRCRGRARSRPSVSGSPGPGHGCPSHSDGMIARWTRSGLARLGQAGGWQPVA